MLLTLNLCHPYYNFLSSYQYYQESLHPFHNAEVKDTSLQLKQPKKNKIHCNKGHYSYIIIMLMFLAKVLKVRV